MSGEATTLITEQLSRIATLDDARAVSDFIDANSDIAERILKVVEATQALTEVLVVSLSVFSDPLSDDQSLYVSATVQGIDYSKAYEAENKVFEAAIEPYFKEINYRILLSFDSDL